MSVTRHVIAALVQNEPGVLAHVAGMFAARGFNIDSLVVGRTENNKLSRMTIVLTGDDAVLEQVRKQLAKIVEVVKVVDYSGTDYVERDLLLVRLNAGADQRNAVIQLAQMFRGKVVDVGHGELMIELSGTEDKLESFIELAQPHGIVEVARTGVIAMPRSEKTPGKTPVARRVRATAGPDDADDAGPTIDPGDLPPG